MGKILQYLHSHGIHRAFSSLRWSLQLTVCCTQELPRSHFQKHHLPFFLFQFSNFRKGQSVLLPLQIIRNYCFCYSLVDCNCVLQEYILNDSRVYTLHGHNADKGRDRFTHQ